jgi:hypothetical protein
LSNAPRQPSGLAFLAEIERGAGGLAAGQKVVVGNPAGMGRYPHRLELSILRRVQPAPVAGQDKVAHLWTESGSGTSRCANISI